MFVMGCYGHKLSNGVLFAHHLILDVPGGSSHLGYRRRVPLVHNPRTRVLNMQLSLCAAQPFLGGFGRSFYVAASPSHGQAIGAVSDIKLILCFC